MWQRFKVRHVFYIAMTMAVFSLTTSISHGQAKAQVTPALPKCGDLEQVRQTLKKLSVENERLTRKIADLERRLGAESVRNHLTQEEQRAESLQSQLLGVAEKEGQLQSQLDQNKEQFRNIDSVPIYGSVRPDEIRESTRRRLTAEQTRIQSQLDLVQQSRTRLQSSLAVTDMLIQNLRLQLQAALHP